MDYLYQKPDYKQAIQYSYKTINNPAFSKYDDMGKWPTYMQIGRGYESLGNLDSAQYYAKMVADCVAKYGHLVPTLAMDSYALFANIAFKKRQFPEALKYYYLANDNLGIALVYQQQEMCIRDRLPTKYGTNR